jgi:energy-coupling factor transport system substrate-specific component
VSRLSRPLRASGLLGLTSLLGLGALLWPFAAPAQASASSAWLLLALVALLLGLCAVELARGRFDARGIAVLGILAACGTALRLPSPGVAGFEPMFFLLVLGGAVYGASFGFALGGTTLLASALVTGGVGPWLPFQMLAAGWVGLGAGLLPRMAPRWERAELAAYAALACLGYGVAMNLWFWPTLGAGTTSVSFVPGAGWATNLAHFAAFDLTTSLGFDLPRAVLNAALILVLGRPVLVALRRTAARTTRLEPYELLEPSEAA